MTGRTDTFTVEGTVHKDSLDAIHLSHQVYISAADGHTYEVEPSYVGRYLEKFEGHHVVTRVQPITNGRRRSVVRILSLEVLDKPQGHANADNGRDIVPPDSDCRDLTLTKLEVEETQV
jgi:hypothetical protein